MSKKVYVDTSEYVFSHERGPRGRGGWLFAFGRRHSGIEDEEHWHNFNGTYGEAKKQAVAKAKADGVCYIAALP